MLEVSEMFYSIQGEGLRAGQATVFIRLSGCNLRCSFCDTKYAWGGGESRTIEQLLLEIAAYPCTWVCITGGEPFLQDITGLTQSLYEKGYKVQVETNGSLDFQTKAHVDHLTVSPKVAIKPYYVDHADEFKYVVSSEEDLKRILPSYLFNGPIYLQPESNKKEAVEFCTKVIKETPKWRLSLQLQKILGIR